MNRTWSKRCWRRMHRGTVCSYILLTTLVVSMLHGCTRGPSVDADDIDQSTPEATVLNLYEAFNDDDAQLLQALLDMDDDSNRKALKGFKLLVASKLHYEITDVEMDVVENDGRMARIRTRYHHTVTMGDEVVADTRAGAELTLVNRDGRWYFIGLGQWPPPGWGGE